MAAGGLISAVGLFRVVLWGFALSVTLLVKARSLTNPASLVAEQQRVQPSVAHSEECPL